MAEYSEVTSSGSQETELNWRFVFNATAPKLWNRFNYGFVNAVVYTI